MMVIDAITEIGTLRRGSLVSSASGAAASQPVSPWTENTIASVKPESAAMLAGLNTCSETPPSPGWRKPDRASRNTMPISKEPAISMARAEILIPWCWRNATNGAPTTMHTHHSHGTSMS